MVAFSQAGDDPRPDRPVPAEDQNSRRPPSVVVTGRGGVEVLPGVVCRRVVPAGCADCLTAVGITAVGGVEVAGPLGEVGELSSGLTKSVMCRSRATR